MDSSETERPLNQATPSTNNNNETLKLGGVTLTFEGDNLIVKDKAQAKKNRNKVCGVPIGHTRPELSIPFYQVLWAEAVDGSLIIDYAHISQNHQQAVRPRRLAYPLPSFFDNKNDADATAAATSTTIEPWIEALLTRAYPPPTHQRRRRAKVLVNPHAGPGGALKIWENEVRPLFEAARLAIDATYTQQSGEAVRICEKLDLGAYDVVVPCSGDGLAHEVFNGLGRRRDARAALRKMPVAHIPCGSGNAMSINLNGSPKPGLSALAVVKGVRTPLDLMSVTQGGGGSGSSKSENGDGEGEGNRDRDGEADKDNEEPVRRTLSFLSQSVGIIADCDLGTENMRWMGSMRFDVGVAMRIFSKKVYPCDVAIKVEIADKDGVKARYRQEKTGAADFNVRRQGSGLSEDLDLVEDGEDGLPQLRFGSINDKVPEDWEKFSYDNMGNFYCGNMPFMAPDVNFFPASAPNDGLMDLIVNDGNIPVAKYINLMTSVEKEKYFDNPLISYRKVVAYRITPRDQKDGYISIDGERIPFEPFQVEIHQGLATVLSKNGRYEANGPTGWENAVAAGVNGNGTVTTA